jgi:hypothetical protein
MLAASTLLHNKGSVQPASLSHVAPMLPAGTGSSSSLQPLPKIKKHPTINLEKRTLLMASA